MNGVTPEDLFVLAQLETPGALNATLQAERKEFDNTTPAMRRAPIFTALHRIRIVFNNHMELATRAVY